MRQLDALASFPERVLAIACHRSQGRDGPGNQELLRTIAAERGRRSALPVAEAFRILVPG